MKRVSPERVKATEQAITLVSGGTSVQVASEITGVSTSTIYKVMRLRGVMTPVARAVQAVLDGVPVHQAAEAEGTSLNWVRRACQIGQLGAAGVDVDVPPTENDTLMERKRVNSKIHPGVHLHPLNRFARVTGWALESEDVVLEGDMFSHSCGLWSAIPDDMLGRRVSEFREMLIVRPAPKGVDQ